MYRKILFTALISLVLTINFPLQHYSLKLILTSNIPNIKIYYDRGDRRLKLHYSPEKISHRNDGFFDIVYMLPVETIDRLLIKPDLDTYSGSLELKYLAIAGDTPLYKFSSEPLKNILVPVNHILNVKLANQHVQVMISGAFPLLGIDFNRPIQRQSIAELITDYRVETFWPVLGYRIFLFIILFGILFYMAVKSDFINQYAALFSKMLFSSYRRAFCVLISGIILINTYVFYDFITFEKCLLYYDIASDTAFQMLPYMHHFVERIRDGAGLFWSFGLGIGTATHAFENLYGFYDPIAVIFHLVPSGYIPYVFVFVLILKIMLGAIGIFGFMRKIKIDPFVAVIVAILYAHSGYMIGFGSWVLGWGASTAALLPFVLLAIETFLQDSRKWCYIPISVAWYAVSSAGWVTLFQLSIICFIYLSIRFWYLCATHKVRAYVLQLVTISLLFALGICFVAMLIFPQLQYILLDTARNIQPVLDSPPHTVTIKELTLTWLRLFSNDILGTAGVNSIKDFAGNYFTAPFLYTGLISILLIPLLFFLPERTKIKRGSALFILIAVMIITIPQFRALFWGGQGAYHRMTSVYYPFIFSLLASLSLHYFITERRGLDKKIIILIVMVSCMLLVLPIRIINAFNDITIIDWQLVKYSVLLLILYSLLIVGLTLPKYMRLAMFGLLIVVCYEAEISSWRSLNYKRKTTDITYCHDDDAATAIASLHKHDPTFYRLEKSYSVCGMNDAMVQGYYSISGYASFHSFAYIDLLQKLHSDIDILRIQGANIRSSLQSLLGVKYYLSYKDGIQVRFNKKHIPLGTCFDKIIIEEEFQKLPQEIQDDVLLYALIVNEQTAKLPDFTAFKRIGPTGLHQDQLEADKQQTSLSIEQFKSDKIWGHITTEKRRLLFFSIPYDIGWQLFINDQQTPLYKVDYGLMAAILESGSHQICLKFTPRFFKAGMLVSIVSVLTFAILMFYKIYSSHKYLCHQEKKSLFREFELLAVMLLIIYFLGYLWLVVRMQS